VRNPFHESLRAACGVALAAGLPGHARVRPRDGLGTLVIKVKQHYPDLEYAQLLATYHFGLMRRALIGQLWAIFRPQVAASEVYVLGISVLLVTIVAFVLVFRSIFRFSHDTLPLFALTAGSPFTLKNFAFTVGYFDVYGCLVALIALALPLNAFYVVIVGALGILLLFVHHLHFLLYLPAIGLIALLRHRAAGRLDAARLAVMAVLAGLPSGRGSRERPRLGPRWAAWMTRSSSLFPLSSGLRPSALPLPYGRS
jgi:hypothetical protein